jgi:hypothetical protein
MRALSLLFVVLISACADKSSSIQASYVSPLAYNSYDCSALEQEYARLVRKSQSINKQQDDIASNDSVATGVGLILFWPALFFIDNDDLREQVAQLKGEVDAVEQAAIQKNCSSVSSQISSDKKASN